MDQALGILIRSPTRTRPNVHAPAVCDSHQPRKDRTTDIRFHIEHTRPSGHYLLEQGEVPVRTRRRLGSLPNTETNHLRTYRNGPLFTSLLKYAADGRHCDMVTADRVLTHQQMDFRVANRPMRVGASHILQYAMMVIIGTWWSSRRDTRGSKHSSSVSGKNQRSTQQLGHPFPVRFHISS